MFGTHETFTTLPYFIDEMCRRLRRSFRRRRPNHVLVIFRDVEQLQEASVLAQELLDRDHEQLRVCPELKLNQWPIL